MPVLLSQRPVISVGDVDVAAIDCQEYLDSGELLTGTPTVVEIGRVLTWNGNDPATWTTTTDLTLTNKAVNAVQLPNVLGNVVPIGMAVQFKVSTIVAGTYIVRITVGTTSTPARTKVIDALITVK